MLYRLTLRHHENALPPSVRTIARDDLVAAVEGAIRWLRLTRNTAAPDRPRYDRWVIAVQGERGGWIDTVSGDIDQPRVE